MIDIVLIIIISMYGISIVFIYCNHHQKKNNNNKHCYLKFKKK